MLTKFQVDIINLRTPAAPHTRRRILLSSTVARTHVKSSGWENCCSIVRLPTSQKSFPISQHIYISSPRLAHAPTTGPPPPPKRLTTHRSQFTPITFHTAAPLIPADLWVEPVRWNTHQHGAINPGSIHPHSLSLCSVLMIDSLPPALLERAPLTRRCQPSCI